MTNVRKRSGCDSGIIADIVSVAYKMTHKYRGRALIFNNEHFDDINLSPRMGTHMDSERLEKELQRLGFKVREYMDYTKKDILSKIKKTAARDHSEYDCVWIAILSHGKNGYIHARDALYSVEDIWRPFAEDKCPTLAGKPKLFFIQACQGDRTDPGYPLLQPEMMDNETSSFMCCRMPMCKDFLIAFSTLPGFCSWRNTLDGSWFIQSLCEELALKGSSSHLLTLLSSVAGRVAFNFESYNPSNPTMHQKKQITFTMSTLTRILCFPDKSSEEFNDELDK